MTLDQAAQELWSFEAQPLVPLAEASPAMRSRFRTLVRRAKRPDSVAFLIASESPEIAQRLGPDAWKRFSRRAHELRTEVHG
jgi:hypothetical protein